MAEKKRKKFKKEKSGKKSLKSIIIKRVVVPVMMPVLVIMIAVISTLAVIDGVVQGVTDAFKYMYDGAVSTCKNMWGNIDDEYKCQLYRLNRAGDDMAKLSADDLYELFNFAWQRDLDKYKDNNMGLYKKEDFLKILKAVAEKYNNQTLTYVAYNTELTRYMSDDEIVSAYIDTYDTMVKYNQRDGDWVVYNPDYYNEVKYLVGLVDALELEYSALKERYDEGTYEGRVAIDIELSSGDYAYGTQLVNWFWQTGGKTDDTCWGEIFDEDCGYLDIEDSVSGGYSGSWRIVLPCAKKIIAAYNNGTIKTLRKVEGSDAEYLYDALKELDEIVGWYKDELEECGGDKDKIRMMSFTYTGFFTDWFYGQRYELDEKGKEIKDKPLEPWYKVIDINPLAEHMKAKKISFNGMFEYYVDSMNAYGVYAAKGTDLFPMSRNMLDGEKYPAFKDCTYEDAKVWDTYGFEEIAGIPTFRVVEDVDADTTNQMLDSGDLWTIYAYQISFGKSDTWISYEDLYRDYGVPWQIVYALCASHDMGNMANVISKGGKYVELDEDYLEKVVDLLCTNELECYDGNGLRATKEGLDSIMYERGASKGGSSTLKERQAFNFAPSDIATVAHRTESTYEINDKAYGYEGFSKTVSASPTYALKSFKSSYCTVTTKLDDRGEAIISWDIKYDNAGFKDKMKKLGLGSGKTFYRVLEKLPGGEEYSERMKSVIGQDMKNEKKDEEDKDFDKVYLAGVSWDSTVSGGTMREPGERPSSGNNEEESGVISGPGEFTDSPFNRPDNYLFYIEKFKWFSSGDMVSYDNASGNFTPFTGMVPLSEKVIGKMLENIVRDGVRKDSKLYIMMNTALHSVGYIQYANAPNNTLGTVNWINNADVMRSYIAKYGYLPVCIDGKPTNIGPSIYDTQYMLWSAGNDYWANSYPDTRYPYSVDCTGFVTWLLRTVEGFDWISSYVDPGGFGAYAYPGGAYNGHLTYMGALTSAEELKNCRPGDVLIWKQNGVFTHGGIFLGNGGYWDNKPIYTTIESVGPSTNSISKWPANIQSLSAGARGGVQYRARHLDDELKMGRTIYYFRVNDFVADLTK